MDIRVRIFAAYRAEFPAETIAMSRHFLRPREYRGTRGWRETTAGL